MAKISLPRTKNLKLHNPITDYSAQVFVRGEKHLSKNDPKLAALIAQFGPLSLEPHTDHYGQLVREIVGQQLSTKAARSIYGRVKALFGDKVPTAKQLVKADSEALRAAGLSYAKVSYIKDLAQHVLDKRLDLAHVSTMPNDQLIEQLTAVKGIGEWSAHMFMIFGLGRLDVLPVGDLGVRKAIQNVYKLKELPDPAAIINLANRRRWQPYESVAALYLWASLDNSPHK